MEISQHYPAYSIKTYLVVSNNELAHVYTIEDRHMREIREFRAPEIDRDVRLSGTPNEGPHDFDTQTREAQKLMYNEISSYLLKILQKEPAIDIVLCAPEALKNDMFEAMHTDVQRMAKEVIPKNLASLPLDQIIRILQENR